MRRTSRTEIDTIRRFSISSVAGPSLTPDPILTSVSVLGWEDQDGTAGGDRRRVGGSRPGR